MWTSQLFVKQICSCLFLSHSCIVRSDWFSFPENLFFLQTKNADPLRGAQVSRFCFHPAAIFGRKSLRDLLDLHCPRNLAKLKAFIAGKSTFRISKLDIKITQLLLLPIREVYIAKPYTRYQSLLAGRNLIKMLKKRVITWSLVSSSQWPIYLHTDREN